ncbi:MULTISPECIES: hypothetical protein [unclassified Oceanispirochaeta]|uniref:hypothetical protein n=1 Tax=unclassified Oceanispirochaeta TaxID=2635722 RepID=UPI000E0990C4|nr:MULTISPECIES: hypothetical protein [unclassified Oceanispirochaeta]MBF9016592.1 hypothetical protein [Oceanispirochaeta sp. M2]NPD73055.1 hypothetical protein [Oceanispirochaeta sp. M1]RDG31400.1 hypothetical protein DV872_13195 [Oceanispirochaeta sp. M1]
MSHITSRGYLYLILKDENIQIGFGAEGFLFFSGDYGIDDQQQSIPDSIKQFLQEYELDEINIEALIILKEIQGLFSHLITDTNREIAYLQISDDPSVPMQFMNRVGSSGCHLTLAYLKENKYGETEKILDSFLKKGIREVAINACYSPLKPRLEEELALYLEQKRPSVFQYNTPEIEDYQPYLTKENKLLINTILKRPLSQIWDQIASVLPQKTQLFCCGDGFIRDRKTIAENPLLLWQSEKAQLLRGTARTHNLNTFISMLPWGDKGMCLNMVQEGTPQISTGSKLFSGLPIALDTLQNTTSQKWPTPYKLRELFSRINPTLGPVDILNGTDKPFPSEFLSYREKPLILSKRVHMLGMTRTPYHNRLFRLIKSRNPEDIKDIEKEMIHESISEEIRLGLKIYSKKNEFKLTTLKYIKKGWGMLYLDTTGILI